MVKKRKLKSITTLTFISLGLLPIMILGSFIVLILNRHLSNDIIKENVVVVNSVANQTEDFLNTPLLILEQMKNLVEDKKLIQTSDFNSFLSSYIYKYSFFESIHILNKNGTILNTAPFRNDIIGIDYSSDNAFINASVDKPYWSSVFISLNTGEPTLTISVAYKDGVVIGNLSLIKLSSFLDTRNLPTGVLAGIIDNNGIFIAHTNISKVNQREQEPLNKEIQTYIKDGKNYSSVLISNEKFFISYSQIKKTGWTIIVYQKEETAFKSVNTVINVFIGGLVLSLIVILIISFFGYRSIINPISEIIKLTKKISGGEYSQSISLDSFIEINDLAESLNKMTSSIKSREEELVTQQKNLHQASRLANLGYWIWTVETDKIRFSSEATMVLQINNKELTPEEFAEKMHPEDKKLFLTSFFESINNNIPYDFNFRVVNPDNSFSYFFSQAESVVDTEKNVISMIGVIQNITAQKMNEKKLEELLFKEAESGRLKDSLLSNINHELRTPMNGILGLTTILLEKHKNSDCGNILESIQLSGKRLMSTLNSIIEISELESNQYINKKSAFNVFHETKLHLHDFSEIASEKNLTFDIRCSNRDLTAFADPGLFRKIIGHLVDNAIKYTESGGIKVIIDKGDINSVSYIKVYVEDTGIGIEGKNHDLIFEEFRQVSEGYSRKFEGSGLGLSLVKKMVKLSEGEISLESWLGKGSIFCVTFPAADDIIKYYPNSEDAINHINKKLMQLKSDKKIAVLYVEDNAINKQVVFSYLKDQFELYHSFTGEKAIKEVQEQKINLILMDINLGSGIDGVQTLIEIRKLAGYETVPAIAITGYAMSNDEEKFLSKGFSGYLAKPFNKDELLEAISKIEIKT